MSSSVSAPHAAWLLTRLRLHRLWNQTRSVYRFRKASAGRTGTARKSSTGWMLTTFVVLAMFANTVNLSHQGFVNLERAFGSTDVAGIAMAPGSVLAPGVLHGATLVATLLLLTALLLTIATREITRPEWDLEWLITLPLPLPALLFSRLIERAVTNPAGLVMLAPFLSVLAWECGYRWSAPLVGIGLTLALQCLVATFQTLVDTGLRMSLSPSRLRNLQAVVSVVAMLPALLALTIGVHDSGFVFGWAAALPGWMDYLPSGLVVRAVAAADNGSAALWLAAAIGEIVALVAAGYMLLRWQLRDGVVGGGAREAGVRLPRAARRIAADARDTRALLPAVQRRELRLLGRDRTFMAQTLLLPVVMVATQLVLNAKFDIFSGAVERPENLSAVAFGIAAYTLMLSAFQTLNTEGQALWILYCVPQPLEAILWQKAKLWAVAALIYPLIIFAVAIGLAGHVTVELAGCAVIVLLGVPIFAVIATALGVFGCDPLAQEVQRRVRLTYLYLYLVLASLYVYALYAVTLAQRGAMMILTALLAIALWQKARDRLDYLLDPSASPPARVSVADGMIAALMFFVLQAIVGVAFRLGETSLPQAAVISIAFCIAGAVTYAVMRLAYRLTSTSGVPSLLGPGVPRALLLGVAGGAAASVAGIAYLEIGSSMGVLPPLQGVDRTTALWLAVLAVAAAPIFEEFIFRGLIFGGLRRSLGFGAATLASAAIFAIVHPPISIIPVFFMAICAALIYERTKMLAAPMVVHGLYNAAVLGFQWYVMQ